MTGRIAQRTSAAGLGAIAGLHLLWATGSAWPMADKAALADAAAGRRPGGSPSPAACVAVAGLLTTAATLVAGRPRRFPLVRRAGSAAVVAVLTTRGAL